MSEEFRYEHSTKGAVKKRRLMALDEFVRKCLRINGVVAVLFEVAFWLYVISWHGLLRVKLGSFGWAVVVSGAVAMVVSAVTTIRVIVKVLMRSPWDWREISWLDVGMTVVLGVVPWATLFLAAWLDWVV